MPDVRYLITTNAVLLVLMLSCGARAAVVPDQSLAPAQYVARGAPAVERPWTGKDFVTAAEALKRIVAQDPTLLPRYKSARSGDYFAQMVSPESLAPLKSSKLPIEARMTYAVDMFDGPRQLLVLYMESGKNGMVFDDEVAELLGFQLQVIDAVLDPFAQFLDGLNGADPRVRAKIAAISQMRDGLATIVDGAMQMMEQRSTYRLEPRRRLADYMKQTLPKIAPELPAKTRNDLPTRLSTLAIAEDDQTIKSTLEQTLRQVRDAGVGRLDAAVSAIEREAKNAPPARAVWSWHTSQTGGFRGEFPGEPKEQVRKGTSRSGKPMSATIMGMQGDDGATYTIMKVDGGDMQIPDLGALDQVIGSMYPNATVVERSEFTAEDGSRGRQMLLRSDKALLTLRALAVNNAFLGAIAESPDQKENRSTESAKRFIESLQISNTSR